MASHVDIAKSKTNPANVAQIEDFVVSFLKSDTISKYMIGKIVKFYLNQLATQSNTTITQYFESNMRIIVTEILRKIHPVIGSDGKTSPGETSPGETSPGETASMKISDLYERDEFVETFYWKSLGVFNEIPVERTPIVRFVPTEHLTELVNEGFDIFVKIQMDFIAKKEEEIEARF
jgi:hypothetical protein